MVEGQPEFQGPEYWNAIKDAIRDVGIHNEPDGYDQAIAKHATFVQVLIAVSWANAEICNGGFHQFFLNGSGVCAPQAVEGFAVLGRGDLATLLSQAMDRVGKPYPRSRKARHDVLELGAFRDLEDQYFKLNHDLISAMNEYARTQGKSLA